MHTPIIGLTTSLIGLKDGRRAQGAAQAYLDALTGAGACPVLVPAGLSQAALEALWPRLDGLLFSGGGDIAPAHYGKASGSLDEPDSPRDLLELRLAQRAIREGRPFFGICRGLQLVNVALGGTLYIDLDTERPGSQQHQYSGVQPREYLAHPVQVQPGSRLGIITGGDGLQVNSLHHQGIERLGAGLAASAVAPDGLVEAIELPGHPFGLAVQWHPECLPGEPAAQALFTAFIEATRSHGR